MTQLALAFAEAPEPEARTSSAWAAACPLCSAAIGEPCQPGSRDPERWDWTHALRQYAVMGREPPR